MKKNGFLSEKNGFKVNKHMKNSRKPRFFEKIENYENYIFGIKEKAAFRYADRKKSKKIKKTIRIFSGNRTAGIGTGPDRNRTEPNRGFHEDFLRISLKIF